MTAPVVLAPGILMGWTGIRSFLFGVFSFSVSAVLAGFYRSWREKRERYLLTGFPPWLLVAWYVVVGMSLIPSAAAAFGLPEQSYWWFIIVIYGLFGWFVRWRGFLDGIGGILYSIGLYVSALGFSPSIAVWALSANLVAIYFGLLIPSIHKMLTLKQLIDGAK